MGAETDWRENKKIIQQLFSVDIRQYPAQGETNQVAAMAWLTSACLVGVWLHLI
jgi:hypothetical protein